MDQLSALSFPLLPYSQASPAQLAQAVFTAKETLGPNYSDLPWSQWYEAFAYFQPLLLSEPDKVNITGEGLIAIAQYFDAQAPAPVPKSPLLTVSSSDPKGISGSSLPPTALRQVKRTYSLHPDVLESLERVSFWRRVKKSALVNLALMRLLLDYSESQDPILFSQ
jgi:hypothetical protein